MNGRDFMCHINFFGISSRDPDVQIRTRILNRVLFELYLFSVSLKWVMMKIAMEKIAAILCSWVTFKPREKIFCFTIYISKFHKQGFFQIIQKYTAILIPMRFNFYHSFLLAVFNTYPFYFMPKIMYSISCTYICYNFCKSISLKIIKQKVM